MGKRTNTVLFVAPLNENRYDFLKTPPLNTFDIRAVKNTAGEGCALKRITKSNVQSKHEILVTKKMRT